MKKHPFLILMTAALMTVTGVVPVMADTLVENSENTELTEASDQEELTDPEGHTADDTDPEEVKDPSEDEGENPEEGDDGSGEDVYVPYDEGHEEEVREEPRTLVTVIEEVVEIVGDENGKEEDESSEDTPDEDGKESDGKGDKEKKKGPPRFAPPLPVPSLTGDWREDFVEVARSQIGYREASDGSSYFGNRIGITYSAWCTAFITWCAKSAGIPQSSIPHVLTSRKYVEIYAPKDRFFYVKGGVDAADTVMMREGGYEGIKTIKPTSIKPGDLLLFDTDGNGNDGPDHVAIFISYDKEARGLVNLSGNSNNSVNITTKDLSTLFGVCRPVFDKKAYKPDDAAFDMIRNTSEGIKIRWDECEGASGYEVYARKIGEDAPDEYVQVTDAAGVYSENTWTFTGLENGERLSFYVRPYAIVSDEYPTVRVYGRRTPKKSYIYLEVCELNIQKDEETCGVSLEWEANDDCSGYQIQCSTDRDFSDHKSITVMPGMADHKKLTGLDEGEEYYVRIRPFIRRKDKTYYGAWKRYETDTFVQDT
ncbi:MAG: hypothetical protein K6F28_00740 [Lachnospiraceae bacterium]|nr:hypothetical protein [Lachnospiraceae bacterium]